MYSVDIDVGGTLTDGIFTDGARIVCAKVDTTAHDLTVCLFDCLAQGAIQLGFADLEGFLEQVELLRWSTTITSNVLAELRGPKIGLIVSKGHEKDLYGLGISPVLNKVVNEANVIGIEASGAEVLPVVRSLLESGVRRICISLQGALQNPEHEQRIKKTIDDQYPDHYLGSVPVLTGSDICKNADDMTRTYYAMINAYTHSALAATLFKAEDELRYTHGYSRAFLISHINGGVAGVAKTRAIDTMESGPILGIYGASHLSKLYGVENVIALDVGGTTAKVGLIQKGEPVYVQESDLFGIPVKTRLPYLRSIALGGGSVVHVNDGQLQLGPESMGSFPGPACYALGGDKPTLTDAFVTAGLIDPEYFLAGAKQLDRKLAVEAIETAVAQPSGISVEQACQNIIGRAYDMVADMILEARKQLNQDGPDPALFAYGGNGSLFACGVAERAHINQVFLFSLGPVFSAFGSSVSDIVHVYEEAVHLSLLGDGDITPINRAIEKMHSMGTRDLRGEGISPHDAQFSIELELSSACGSGLQVKCPERHFGGIEGLRRVIASQAGPKHTSVELVRLYVRKAIARPALLAKDRVSEAKDALIGTRPVSYGSGNGKATIYRWESFQPQEQVQGCALLESASSTYLIPQGWELQMDRFGNARLTNRAEKSLETFVSGAVQESHHGK